MIWHSSDISEVLQELSSDKQNGLDGNEVSTRLECFGKNEIHDFNLPSFWQVFLKRIRDAYTVILFVIALLYLIVALIAGGITATEPILIISAIIINCFVGAYILYRNQKKVDRLSSSHPFYSTVIRDGYEQLIPSTNIVPGDIMLLSSGDYVAADGRIIDSYVFICNELAVTGENIPIEKTPERIMEDIAPLSDRTNMVYSGSYIVSGKATVIVTETGSDTAIGRAESIKKQIDSDTTPLHSRIISIEKNYRLICVIGAALISVMGIIANVGNYKVSFAVTVLNYILLGLCLVVSSIPNGMPTIFKTSVSFAALRLQNRNLTFLNLPSAESVGGASVICTDKTGVLTDDNNNLVKLWSGKSIINLSKDALSESEVMLLHLGLICSNFDENEHLERHSNALELAIERACIKATGMSKTDIDGMYPRLCELPFDSTRMMMTTVTVINTKPYAVIKGAPEVILSRCTDQNTENIMKSVDKLADEGLKVLAVAIKPLSEIPVNPTEQELENGLMFVGLLGFDNPTEPSCIEEITECKRKNIRVVMITGDYKRTSAAVAKEIGIISDISEAVDHSEIESLTDEELRHKVNLCSVFSRATADDKKRIVSALKANGERVLLTCDNVGDLPSLAIADFSASLGQTSAESVKISSDFIVSDNKFTTLTLALKESNRIYDGVIRCVKYMMCCSATQIAAILFGIIVFGFSPIGLSALIWFNLLINLLPVLAFSCEFESQTLSLRRHESHNLVNLKSIISLAVPSIIVAVLTLIGFGTTQKLGNTLALTTAFAILCICQIVRAFTLSHTYTIFQIGTIRNLIMPAACLISILLLSLMIFTPLGSIFSLSSPGGNAIIFIIVSAIITLLIDEVVKLINKRI